MKPFAFSLLLAALAVSASAQTPATPTTPTKFGTAGTGSGVAASGTAAPAKPISPSDKKFVKDVSEGVLIEQKYLALVTENRTATFSEELKRGVGSMAGELKRIWTALATLAVAKGAEVAQEVNKNDLAKVAKVQKEKPDKFEKEFYSELAKETKKTAKLFDSAKTLQDPEIKRFAEDWATIIKGHEATMEKASKPAKKK
jgi:predicted outer membrane protein